LRVRDESGNWDQDRRVSKWIEYIYYMS